MKKRIFLIALSLMGLVTIIIFGFMFLKDDRQTCTYKDEEYEMSVKVPKTWAYEISERFDGDSNREGSPNFGINILIDGDIEDSIYFYYNYGTISPQIDEILTIEDFETKEGLRGKIYEGQDGNQTRLMAMFEPPYNHYAFSLGMENDIFEANEKNILKALESISIKTEQ